ncbi:MULTISPECIES: peptide-methionine (S)-S-oxide reductase MsrA [unclassified Beijerinckia]|uniref:peptide-methionine (S)-S-oxide reductase MsrA n=1 Tax=unclassified Beijerinckia TaxID=2638183 RepID=UPI00089C5D32|nr:MULTISPECIES: peptide-methionine (S)-S-oxide reductase MsrA [unclassified Beijerinckia]MDH7797531.1 peptide-methionine (S)-S-oxide reductase [Beijerinckia sp. GAS462]SEC89372.1 peptide-methionine (S)-S-oxide reductase [Beijerinckia sp. 28-YEA-48]
MSDPVARFFGKPQLVAIVAACGIAASTAFFMRDSVAAEQAVILPPPTVDESASGPAVAVLAGGCFWGVQGVFQHVDGVINAVSGYAGGEKTTATYQQTSSGKTGHAESVQITYDPKKVSYGKLLQIYFSVAHDPTQLNRQGPDVGTQYRSAIFPTNAEQEKVAKAYIAQLNGAQLFRAAIVTRIEPGRTFYPAEAYHQNYLTLHPANPYIVINDKPKVENLMRVFPDIARAQPTLVKVGDATD